NGDSLQKTTTGLMVWRKADNWTAFTNGDRSWINGPNGVEDRPNSERFAWEADQAPAETMAPAPKPSPTPVLSAPQTPPTIPTPTPPAAPTAQPAANIRVLSTNTIPGAELDANRVYITGEIVNDGPTPAYNITVSGQLLDVSGAAMASNSQVFPYLGAGDKIGYRVDVKILTPYANQQGVVKVTGRTSSPTIYKMLSVAGKAMEKSAQGTAQDGTQSMSLHYPGTITNNTASTMTLNVLYVWFLDDQNNVIWAESTYISPNGLAPGGTFDFDVESARSRYVPKATAITQVKAYAYGVPSQQ
ncbi:MAG TPA: FxLYD domain-containing protein, partial [Chloroflexota bacterium]|nr:FxLYD domain-containing protein [Chloroflexota bacterium]